MTLPTLVGCVVGLAGVVVANLGGGSIGTQMHINGEGFVFIAALFYAISSIYLQRYSQKDDPVMLSGYQFLVGGVILSVIGFAMGGRLSGFMVQSSLLLLYLGFLSAMAYALWGILLKYNPVSRVAIYGFTNPVIGVLLSAILLGEGGPGLFREKPAGTASGMRGNHCSEFVEEESGKSRSLTKRGRL